MVMLHTRVDIVFEAITLCGRKLLQIPDCSYNMRLLLLVVALVAPVSGDIYLHVPRGSNNRLSERTANRQNENRLFDSQNNAKGGYNVGDAESSPSDGNENKQYRMKYFQSSGTSLTSWRGAGDSYLTVEWTNQHGCGENYDEDTSKPNCNLVLQYMCQDDVDSASGDEQAKAFALRNGVQARTQIFQNPRQNENQRQYAKRKRAVNRQRGLHEPFDSYNDCYVRERNAGLFTADQDLQTNNRGYSSAIHTRQNSNGDRSGYECPEERDYYPYWHPTVWKDIAVLAEDDDMCWHYEWESFNVQPYHACVEWFDTDRNTRKASRYNTKTTCEANGGVWTEFSNYLEKAPQFTTRQACDGFRAGVSYIWAIPHDSVNAHTPECLVALNAPECFAAPWSRANHLGNGLDGEPNSFTWTLPHFPSGKQQRCVLRMRYNISTDDYDPYTTDASFNQDKANNVYSPVQPNPDVEVVAGTPPLRLAINTAQYGRTFQDRSHVFIIRPRPDDTKHEKIYNLNVRGKRGNIVQVYPAVEYDFFPNPLYVDRNDLVHVQWTGSNTHNNRNDGDAGQGDGGTDRTNVVQIASQNENYPLPYAQTNMWTNAEVKWIYHGDKTISSEDLALSMASSGYYMCKTAAGCPDASQSAETKTSLNRLLNNAPASYEGALLKFKRGEYHYMCTRNNQFTNRDQKATIVVE